MRINKFVAQASGLSRRAADTAISDGRVMINGKPANTGHLVLTDDVITLDGKTLATAANITIMLNKPVDYVVSREGQGSLTVYDLLDPDLHDLKPVGRLDKNSSGLLLLTNDGQLAQELTHPKYQKQKIYQVTLDAPLQPLHRQLISDHGVRLKDGVSKMQLERLHDGDDTQWRVIIHEGRNRQIRRTFLSLGYTVMQLHRIQFGKYTLGDLEVGAYTTIINNSTPKL